MDKIKKVYIDSRYRTADSNSDSGFKVELKEVLGLPEIQYVMLMTFQFHILGIL